MMATKDKFQSILHYIVQKLQNHVKDRFLLHKGSLKLTPRREYKDGKGSKAQIVNPYVLPQQWDKLRFQELRKKLVD